MRQKRAKAYRKLMHVYCMTFGFRQPYQVLVDSEMCLEAVSSKIDLAKQLAVVFQGTVKPMITQCCIHRLCLAGREAQPAVDLAKMFERRRCNHKEAISEEDCIKEVVGPTNKHRYSLASQSTSIRQHARQVPGVPLVHIKRSVIILEPASETTEREKSAMETQRMRPSEAESSNIASTLSKSDTDAKMPHKKKKGLKGPNPLSVKKKKAKESNRRPPARNAEERIQTVGSKRKHVSDDEDIEHLEQERTMDDRTETQTASKRTRKRTRKRKRVGLGRTEGEQADDTGDPDA